MLHSANLVHQTGEYEQMTYAFATFLAKYYFKPVRQKVMASWL